MIEIANNETYEGVDFSDYDLEFASISDTVFRDCLFMGANLSELDTLSCKFIECDFTAAKFNASQHNKTAFTNCTFKRSNMFATKFIDCDLMGSMFNESFFENVDISYGRWQYVDFRMLDLKNHKFENVDFSYSDFTAADMTKCIFDRCKLIGVILRESILTDCDISNSTIGAIDYNNVILKDIIIETYQAVDIVTSLGVKFK